MMPYMDLEWGENRAKLLHQLIAMRETVLYSIFLDMHNA